jgi:putative transposase
MARIYREKLPGREPWNEKYVSGSDCKPGRKYSKRERREKLPRQNNSIQSVGSRKKKKEKKQNSRSIGWQGEKLEITTKEGMELSIKYSNQVWQCDHNYADIMLVDSEGGILGRPMITTVIDTFSRCIVGIHLGLNGASAAVTCLGLRHSIMPKEYGSSYGLSNDWLTYGVPEYSAFLNHEVQ